LQRALPHAVADGHVDAPDVWPEDATRDRFVGDWSLYQRRRGHRTSTDDQLTAWVAVDAWRQRHASAPPRILDLGCGIGSVLLATAYALRPVLAVGVEAQPQSVRLLRRTLDELPAGPDMPAFQIVREDLRALTPDAVGTFPLITGSPPYMPPSDGTMAADPQRRACRFEVRGGVEAYCAAASRLLDAEGTFHLVFQTAWDDRVRSAADAADLALQARLDVHMKASQSQPFLTVYSFGRRAPAQVAAERLTIRGEDGARTARYDAIRRALALDPVDGSPVTQPPRK
jgi:tRNA1(Val) A37 N6-methylase TrmN6